MNILCICAAGSTRSVACANGLKHRGHNAIAAGWHYNAPEPIGMLSLNWADRILLMYHWSPDFIPLEARHKVRYLDVGRDVWHSPTSPTLVQIVGRALDEWQVKGFP